MSAADSCNILVSQALALFTGPNGVNAQIKAMAITHLPPKIESVLRTSAPADVYEKAFSVHYPVLSVYCDRFKNTQTEKFRPFAGTVTLVAELRVSGNRPDELESELNMYVEAACNVLESSRGSWSDAGVFAGGFDVKFQPVRSGGKQFVKSARIEFDVLVTK